LPHVTLQSSPGGPIIDAWIGVSLARRNALTEAGQAVPGPVQARALIDSGASHTCVDPAILKPLSLSPTGSTKVHSPTTGAIAEDRPTYDISLVILHTLYQQGVGPLIRNTMPVICTDLLSGQGIHVLIGRDVLQGCLFVLDGHSGTFSLAY
jgi:hypothetical protein